MQTGFEIKGETVSGNEITIMAEKDYDDCGTRKRWYWSQINVKFEAFNNYIVDLDDLSESNKTHIMDQLPYL